MNSQPPNIILICSDQHRAASLGAYGNSICRTPNLDRLAGQGVTFDRCFAQNPICMASRSTIMTGLLSRNHRVFNNNMTLSRLVPTLADICQTAGYRTVAVGKMHLTTHHDGVPTAPYYGFAQLDCVEDNQIGPYFEWALKNFPEYEGYLVGTLFNLPRNEAYWQGRRDYRKECLAAWEEYVKPLEISATCNWGFGHYSPLPAEAHHNTWITDRAIAQLQAHNPATPLLQWVSYVQPHAPLAPPEKYRRLYRPEDVDARIGTDLDEAMLPLHTRAARMYYKTFTEQDHRILRALYYASVTFVDEQIGRFLKAVEQKLDLRNTIILYLSDHGELLGDYSLYGKTAYHYDSCIRVPLLCRWDEHWPAGQRANAITELTDLTPTLLEAAGMKVDALMDGRSFVGVLTSPGTAARDSAFIESYGGLPEDPSPTPLTWARTIRSDRWRATFYPRSDYGELYDLQNDPHELRNLWREARCREVVNDHRRRLLERVVAAEFPLRQL